MTEIEDLLTRFNVDSRNGRLRDYYEADNIWRTLQIERDENRHSAFLAWLLSKDAVQDNSPLNKFLNLIIRRKESDEADYNELKKAILLGRLKLKSVQVSTEIVVSKISNIRFPDRVDIYVDCEIAGVGDYSRLEIFIENKIDSREGDVKVNGKIDQLTQEEEQYKKKKQTERYYYACSKENNLRIAPFEKNKTLQLFIFLDAKKQKPTDHHFVALSYQDIVDFILEPYLMREDIDNHTSMSVKEYLRILGNPINNKTIMATTNEEKDLLMDFYTRNEDLFKRALEVMRDNAESEEEAQGYNEILTSIKKSKARRFFTINGGEKRYMMYEVVAEFVIHMLKKNKSFDAIDKIIQKYTKEFDCHISTTRENVKRRPEKSFEAEYNGEHFYVTKEWGMGTPGKNFDGLMTCINKEYPDFVIREV